MKKVFSTLLMFTKLVERNVPVMFKERFFKLQKYKK